MKIRVMLAAVVLLSLVLAGAAWAEEKAAAEKPDFEKMSGKDMYKMLCKGCHEADSENGEYTPMSLIMEQWEEFFDGDFAETHKQVVCPKDPEAKVVDHFDEKMLKKLRKFCVDHAADSEQPMTCG